MISDKFRFSFDINDYISLEPILLITCHDKIGEMSDEFLPKEREFIDACLLYAGIDTREIMQGVWDLEGPPPEYEYADKEVVKNKLLEMGMKWHQGEFDEDTKK